MAPDDIRFVSIKEDRDWYYVEYYPPLPEYRFSVLQLSVLDESRKVDEIASAMEREAKTWLGRYPVPLMATSFTLDGSVLRLSPARPINHLIAWLDGDMKEVLRWELVTDAELPSVELEEEAEQTKMRHYFYHCELDPEAFELLKLENFRREAIEKTKSEAAALKKQSLSPTDG